jgi:RNA polymerase sigma-70 factor (ECF subfamily)
MKSVVRYIRKVATHQASESLTDGQLLDAFFTLRDEAAFEALLRRYGPMVLGVCRRVLNNQQDSEDAFQATFLVLVRKAGAIQRRALLGNWLYGVACRTARRARAMNIQRQKKEREARRTVDCEEIDHAIPNELLGHLDAELCRLPDKYRVPIVLCELQGKSRKEAARQLGLAEGTLSWRLAWARKLLARRLAKHGTALLAAGLAASLCGQTSAAIPLTLLSSTAKAAAQIAAGRALTAAVASTQVITLTEGVLKAMLLSKLKVIWTLALVVAMGAGLSGLTYRAMATEPGEPSKVSPQAREASDDIEALRLELEALRRSLQATRERVKSLEGEVQTLKKSSAVQIDLSGGMPASSGGGSNVPITNLLAGGADDKSLSDQFSHVCVWIKASDAEKVLKEQLGDALAAAREQTGNNLAGGFGGGPGGAQPIQVPKVRIHRISVDERTNTILVTGPAEKINQASQILGRIDVNKPPVDGGVRR